MYTNYPVNYRNVNNHNNGYSEFSYDNDERFFLAPFLFGGIAGTALGYGIANNNQLHNGYAQPVYPMYPYPYPVYQSYPAYQSYQSYPTYSNSTSTNTNYYY